MLPLGSRTFENANQSTRCRYHRSHQRADEKRKIPSATPTHTHTAPRGVARKDRLVFFLPIGRFDAALKGHEMESFQPGDRVFAKVRGYPPWPARVDGTTQVQGKTRFHVFFYGTYEV